MSNPTPAGPNWDGVPVYGRYHNLDGTPKVGKVVFTVSSRVYDDTDDIIFPRGGALTETLDGDGYISTLFPAEDDPDIHPNGWWVKVEEKFTDGSGETYNIQPKLADIVSVDAGINLRKVVIPTGSPATVNPTYLRGVAGGVAALDADGKVLDGNGAIVPGQAGAGDDYAPIVHPSFVGPVLIDGVEVTGGSGSGIDVAADDADMNTKPTAVSLVGRADALYQEWIRDATTHDWRVKDSELWVPETLMDAVDHSLIGKRVGAAMNSLMQYASARYSTHGNPFLSSTSVRSLRRSIPVSLVLNDGAEWHLAGDQSDPNNLDIAFSRQRPTLRIAKPIRRLVGSNPGTQIVFHDNGTLTNGIGNGFRAFREDPIRDDGTTAAWNTRTNDFNRARTYGTGTAPTGGTVISGWRYLYAPRAIITADVVAGQYSVLVDNVDGIDRAWFTAHGISIPSTLTGNPISVGDIVEVRYGQNPIDAHEVWDFQFCVVEAINGNVTPGYTTTGPGALTFSKPHPNKVTIANEIWTSPGSGIGNMQHATYWPTGVPNIGNIAVTKVDEDYLHEDLEIGNLTMIHDESNTVFFPSFISLGHCVRPRVFNIAGANPGTQVVDFNCCVDPILDSPRLIAGEESGKPTGGMLFDCTSTKNLRVDNLVADGVYGSLMQAETNSSVLGRNWIVRLDDSIRKFLPGAIGDYRSILQMLGHSTIRIENYDQEGPYSRICSISGGQNEVDSPVKLSGRVRLASFYSAFAGKFPLTFIDREAELTITSPRIGAITTIDTMQFDPVHQADVIGVTPASPNANLPGGLISTGTLTVFGSLGNLTSLVLNNNGVTADLNLLGIRVTDATGSATDSTSDDSGGTDTDRTLTSAGNHFTGFTEGVAVIITGGNLDGTDQYGLTVQDVIDNGHIVLDGMLAKPLVSGTAVLIGPQVVSGRSIKLPVSASSWWVGGDLAFNRGKIVTEMAGNRAQLRATFGAGTGSGVLLRLETRDRRVAMGELRDTVPSITTIGGDLAGDTVAGDIISAMAAKGFVLPGTIDTGPAKGWDFYPYVTEPYRDDEATTSLQLVSGTIYGNFWIPRGSRALKRVYLQVPTLPVAGGTGGTATATYYLAAPYVTSDGVTYTMTGTWASDTAQFSTSDGLPKFVASVAGNYVSNGYPMACLVLCVYSVTGSSPAPTQPKWLSKNMDSNRAGISGKPGVNGFQRFGTLGSGQSALPSSFTITGGSNPLSTTSANSVHMLITKT